MIHEWSVRKPSFWSYDLRLVPKAANPDLTTDHLTRAHVCVRDQVLRILGQMIGGFYAFPVMASILPSYAVASMGGPTLAKGASTGEGMAWEFASTLLLILIVYVAATQVIFFFKRW